MVPRNSQVDFYVGLCEHLLLSNPLDTSSRDVQRDISYLKYRVEHEGLSFLTKTLPRLGKELDKALESLRFEIPQNFKRSKRNRGIPAFMQEYLNRVFLDDGSLRTDACVDAIKHIRAVSYVVYKLQLGYTLAEESVVLNSFVLTDEELSFHGDEGQDALTQSASHIIEGIFLDLDPEDILPRHGPGAVATGEKVEEKWEFSRLYDCIHQAYPYYKYFIVGGARELIDRLAWYKNMHRQVTGCAKVVLVPKDSRGPRLISSEPLEFQWIQQGLGRKIMHHLESFWMTRGCINFKHQEVNQRLALESSLTREFATLDLKDASDRVSLDVVKILFGRLPKLLSKLLATRTTATLLPDGRTITLKKFAPMGSALCFPVESVCFWALAVAAITRFGREPLASIGRQVYVYGDDIIVPSKYADVVIEGLEEVGLLVNRSKSFKNGFFRESCGVDAYKGVDVTPTRVKSVWTGVSTDPGAFAAYVAYANAYAAKGYKHASDYLWSNIESVYGHVPSGFQNSPYICRIVTDSRDVDNNRDHCKTRYNRSLQRIEYRVRVLEPVTVVSGLDGWPRLLKNQVFFGDEVDNSRVVIPRTTKISWKWASG
jgi:hypothetical protein